LSRAVWKVERVVVQGMHDIFRGNACRADLSEQNKRSAWKRKQPLREMQRLH
jgi:hypothetical protein